MERYAPTMKDLAPRDRSAGPSTRRSRKAGAPCRARTPCSSTSGTSTREDHRGEAPRRDRVRADLPERRAHDRAGPDPAHRPLRDGRHPDGRRQAGRGGARIDADPRPVRGRRVRVRLGARGEPAGNELAARHRGVRPPGREGDDQVRKDADLPEPPSGPRADSDGPPERILSRCSDRARTPPTSATELQETMFDLAWVVRTEEGLTKMLGILDDLQGRYARGPDHRQGQALQHRPHGGGRAGLPARQRRDHGRRGARAAGEPGAHWRDDHPDAGRRELVEAIRWPIASRTARSGWSTSRSSSGTTSRWERKY